MAAETALLLHSSTLLFVHMARFEQEHKLMFY